MKKQRFNPMLKFFSNERTGRYLNGENIFPIGIEFSPSGVCPANCRKCFYRVKGNVLQGMDGKFFDLKRFKSLVRELKDCDVKAITWTGGGEPTSHLHFSEMIEIADTMGIQQGLFTNALNPIKYNPEVLQWIRITKTNKPFPTSNIFKLRTCRTIGICINYAKGDEDCIYEGISIVEKLDSAKQDENYSTYLQIRPEMNILGEVHECNLPKISHPLVEVTEKISVTEYGRGYECCEGFHFVPFIWQDGKVYVCAYHKGRKEYELGDLNKQSFGEIMLNSPKFVNVIEECQACCKLHEINKSIEEHKNLVDVNFI